MEPPNSMSGYTSEEVSLAVCVISAQPPSGSTNTNTAPILSTSGQFHAAPIIVFPLIATAPPSSSQISKSDSVSAALKLDVVFQPFFGFTKTYTAPWSESNASGAPTAMVPPLSPIATEEPNSSGWYETIPSVSTAVSIMLVQPRAGLRNTQTSSNPPATTVLPSIATEPKTDPSEAESTAVSVMSVHPLVGFSNT